MLFPRAARCIMDPPERVFRIKARIFEQHKLWPLTTAPWLSHYASLWWNLSFTTYKHVSLPRDFFDDNRVTIPEKQAEEILKWGKSDLSSSIRLQNDSPFDVSMDYISHPRPRYTLFPRSLSPRNRGNTIINISYTHVLSNLTHARIFSYRNRINDK